MLFLIVLSPHFSIEAMELTRTHTWREIVSVILFSKTGFPHTRTQKKEVL